MICIKVKPYKDYRTKNKLVRIDYTTLDLLKDEYVTTNKTYNDIIESRLKEYDIMNQFIKDLNNLITRNNSNNISVNIELLKNKLIKIILILNLLKIFWIYIFI